MPRKEILIYISIFLSALLFRLIVALNYNLPLIGDEVSWDSLAMLIKTTGEYYIENQSFSRPPVYPFFISSIYFIFGNKLIAVRVVQTVIDSFLCILIYRLCCKLFNRLVALIASFSAVGYLLFINSASRILTETLFTFLLFLVVFYIYKTKERLTYINVCMLGVLSAFLTLIKGINGLFLPFLILALLIVRFYRPVPLREISKKLLVMLISFIIPISFWTYRNFLVYHTFVPVSTQAGYALYSCYFPRDGKIFGVNAMDEDVNYAMGLNSEVESSRYLATKTVEFIKRHPFKVLRLEILKIFYFWAPFDWEMMGKTEGVYNFQYMFMLPFSFLGMFLLLRRFNRCAPLYITMVYLFLMSLVFYASPRFRMPIEPYLIIFFALGIIEFFKMFKNKYIPGFISAAYLGINFIMYLNSGITKQLFRDGVKFIGLW